MTPLRIGSLFSGIGGLELGVEGALRAYGIAFETVFQAECAPYPRHLLARHWPNARRFEDVAEVTRENAGRVDLLVGGSPCQDFSLTGPRKGLAGARSGLWAEYSRILAETRPLAMVWENVYGAFCPTKVDGVVQVPGAASVVADLHAHGYDAAWTLLSAAQVGASHLRERIFVVGLRRDGPLRITRYRLLKEALYGARERNPGERPDPKFLEWLYEAMRPDLPSR